MRTDMQRPVCRDAATPDVLKGKWTWRCLLAWLESMQQVPDIGDGFRARIAGPNLMVVIVVVCRSLLPQMPPASSIEDRGTAIPIEDRDRAIPKRLRLCGIGNPDSLSETSSLTPHILFHVTSRKDHSTRGTVGAGVDWTSFAKDSFSRYKNTWQRKVIRAFPCLIVARLTDRCIKWFGGVTWAVCSVHTGRPWVSTSTQRKSVTVHQHTQDVRGCLCMSVSTHRTSVAVHQYTYQHAGPWTQHAGPSRGLFGTHRMSVAVRVCPPAHTGRPWLSICTHISTLVLGCSTLTLPVDCSGDFGPSGLSVQYTRDVRGCPSVHISPLCTHRMSVAVRLCPSAHTGRPWLSICTRTSTLVLGLSMLALPVDYSGDFGPCGLSVQYTQDVCGCPPAHTGRLWVSASTHRTFVQYVAVRQHTQDVRGCPSVHISARWSLDSARWPFPWTVWVILAHVGCPFSTHSTSVGVRQHTQDVRVCLSAHTGRPWLLISTHISTLVLGLSTVTLPVDCSGDFGPRGLSAQYTQDVRVCPSAHTGRPWLSVCVRVCPSAHTGRPWLSISTHISTLVLGLSTLTLPVDCLGDFGSHGLSVQYTQDIHGCPPAHTGFPWLSVCVRVWPSAHTRRLWLSISTHISTLVLGLSTLAFPVDCLGDFGPRGLSVQYTPDIRGCLSAHTAHRTSVGVRQHTQDVRGCPSVHISARWSLDSARWPFPWTIWVILAHMGCLFSTHRSSVGVRQHTQVVRGCLWLSVSTHRTSVAVRLCSCVFVCVREHTHDVRGCTSVHISARWSLDSARWPFLWTVWVILAHVGCLLSTHRTSVGVRQHTQDIRVCPSAHRGRPWLSVCVRVCPSAHTARPWLSISTHISMLVLGLSTLTLPVDCSAHIGRPWLSICTHISTLVLGLSTLALPVDCSGDFGPRGLYVQYTQDICGCPSAHTGRTCVSVSTHRTPVAVCVCPCVSVSTHSTSVAVHQYTYQHVGPWTQHADPSRGLFGTHRTSLAVHQYTNQHGGPWTQHPGPSGGLFGTHRMSVGVRQQTQDVCVCPCVSVSSHRTSVVVHQYTYQQVCPWTQHAGPSPGLFGLFWPTWAVCSVHIGRLWVSISKHRTSVCVRQHTQDVCGCPCVYVCVRQHTQNVRGCPSVHISALWTSVSVRQHTQDVRGCPSVHSTLAFPVDCSGDFGPCGLSVQYTPDIRGCLSAHTAHRTSEGVRQHTQDVRSCPSVSISACWSLDSARWPFPWTMWVILAEVGCLFRTHRSSVGVRQHTQDVRGCLSLSVSTHRTSVAVRLCSCVSVCVREHTQDVRGCPSVHISARWSLDSARWPFPWTVRVILAHVGCLFSTHRTSAGVRQHTQDVRVCPSAHRGRLWLSVCVCACPSAHTSHPWLSISTHISTTHRTFVGVRQHTQDVRGCPCVSVCVCLCPSAHIGRLWLSISTHISMLVLGLSTLALPVDCLGDFGPRGLSVQYTQEVRGCPPAHTRLPWLSVCVRQLTQDVRGCPSVHISARWSLDSARWPFPWTISVILAHVGCLFSTHRTSVGVCQHTQDVRLCPSAHTGHPWLSVCICVCPSAHTGRPWLSISTHISTLVLGLSTLTLPWTVRVILAHVGCLFSTHRTSAGVRQHTQDVRVCPSAHRGRLWLSVCVCACPSAHTSHPWLSISTHISTLVLGLSTLTLPVDCLGDFGSHGLSVQYTQDIHGCPPAHTGFPWLSVCVRVWPSAHTRRLWLSISTHISTLVLGLSTLAFPVDCLGDFGPRGLSVQYTPDIRGCLSAHTAHRTSVGVRQHTQDVRGCPSVHISARWSLDSARWPFPWTIWVILAHMGCLFSTHRSSVGVRQHTQVVRGCLWLSVSTHRTSVAVRLCSCVFVCVREHTHDVRGCTSVHISARWSLDSARWPFLWTVWVILAHVGCLLSTHRTSVGVRQHTQDIRVCPSAHRGRPWLSVCVRVCPSAHTARPWLSISTHISMLVLGLSTLTLPVDCSAHIGRPWLSICTHISTLVLGLSTLALPVDCSGDFGPRGLYVQYTQDICGCPSAHTGRTCVSVSTHRTPVAVCVCPCVSVSTHSTSVAVHQYTYQHVGPWTQHADPSRGLFGTHRTSLAVHQYTNQHGGPWTQHPGPSGGLFGTHRMSVGVRQQTQDVRVCPCVSVSSHRTSVVVHQYTYQQVCPWTQHAGPSPGLFGLFWPTWAVCSVHIGRLWVSISKHRTSVCVRQHTQDGRPCGCPSVHSTLAFPVDCSGDFGPCGLSVQYTPDIRGCLSAHTAHRTSEGVRQHTQDSKHISMFLPVDYVGDFGRSTLCPPQDVRGCLSLSVSTHRTGLCVGISTLVLGLSTLALSVDCSGDFGPRRLSVQYTQDIRGCPSTHTGRPCVSVSTQRTSVAVCVCLCVSVSTHITSVAVHQYTYQHVGPWTKHADPSRGLFGLFWPTWAVCSVHIGRSWVSASTHRTSVAVHVCPYVSVCVLHTGSPWVSASTHKTSVAVRVCPSAHTGRPWLSISTHISTLVLGLSTLAIPVDYFGDFGTWAVCSVHTGRLWVSVSTHRMSVCVRHTHRTSVAVRVYLCVSVSTHRTSVAVRQHTQDVAVHQYSMDSARLSVDCSGDFGPRRLSVQYTQDIRGCPSTHTGRPCVSVSTQRTSVAVCVCLCVSVSTHITSVAVHQYTYQHVGPWTKHADPSRGLFGLFWPTWAVCSVHIGRSWVSASTHRTSVAVHVCPTLALPVDCLGDFGPRGLSVQYTQEVRGCPPAHTRLPWLSVCVRQLTQDVRGCPSVHISARWSLDSARWPFPWTISVILAHVGCLFSTHRTSVGVCQHTQDVRLCPSAHTGHPWLSVCICVCPSAHTGRPWLSISTHISTLVLGLSTLTLPMDCSGDFGPRGLSVQYTQDVRGCPPAQTGRPWLSVRVRVCPSVSVSTHRPSVAVHLYTYQHGGPWTQHAGPSSLLFG
ncbi:hypothetical protein IGI04_042716 [Brassica rapa subsp. trilocularis]|uniref:Uncharacterized protein n=1 Tax=Brassica rapa subsp. trilocularis TaxID=1813537 RepID=A0ABQ7KIQ6_BRACM|nr:hypothetical protein IGI04_042716 [Brassica rapa subsp. trilocularis]